MMQCTVCGADTRAGEACPRCGSSTTDLSGSQQRDDMLPLPQRRSISTADEFALEREKMFHNLGHEGSVELFHDFQSILEHRPPDVPYYTAPEGHPVIAILFSRSYVPDPAGLQALRSVRHPFGLHCAAFLRSAYPVLRMNLLVPDNPDDPLWLETGLDVYEGNAQDFLQSVMRTPRIQLFMTHEAATANVVTLLLEAPSLRAPLRAEVLKVVDALPQGGTTADFQNALNRMEAFFPRAYSGIEPERVIRLLPKMWNPDA